MGAKPLCFLLALALPEAKTGKWLDRFALGMSRAAREFGSLLIGGDTSRSSSTTICITVLGKASAGHALRRTGANPGDLIYVTGILGAAQLGLEILRRGFSQPSFKKHTHPHLYPQVPAVLGQELARLQIPSAMMDISDGLSTDLARLCTASAVGAQIRADRIPSVRVPHQLLARGINSLELALHGGDDYGLLFTMPPKSARRLRHIARDVPIACIGEITRSPKIVLIQNDGRKSSLRPNGWDSFQKT